MFEGYNATILAYGQTSSGKTDTMGNKYSSSESDNNNLGIIPQVVADRFDYTDLHDNEFKLKIRVSFMDIYQEQCYDLLSKKSKEESVVEIREGHSGVILPESIGGNSWNWKAFVSTADYNLEEILSTLRYADRARQIRNKPIVNRDAKSAEIVRFKNLVCEHHIIYVSLLKHIRAENEKFRKWKLENNRNLNRMKAEDRKKQTAIARMETKHAKQQNVLKRTMEELVAIKEQLKDTQEKRKIAQAKRGKTHNKKDDHVQQWLEQELEGLLSTLDDERTLEELMKDRSRLTAQLDQLHADADNYEKNQDEIKKLTNELMLRKAHILDLQQKILSADQENKARTMWDQLHTMQDTKTTLKHLLDKLIEWKRGEQRRAARHTVLKVENERLEDSYGELNEKVQRPRLRMKFDSTVRPKMGDVNATCSFYTNIPHPNVTVRNRGVKHSSNGQTRCSCRGSCANKHCSCKKANALCGDSCKCQKKICRNQALPPDSSLENDEENKIIGSSCQMRIVLQTLESEGAEPHLKKKRHFC